MWTFILCALVASAFAVDKGSYSKSEQYFEKSSSDDKYGGYNTGYGSSSDKYEGQYGYSSESSDKHGGYNPGYSSSSDKYGGQYGYSSESSDKHGGYNPGYGSSSDKYDGQYGYSSESSDKYGGEYGSVSSDKYGVYVGKKSSDSSEHYGYYEPKAKKCFQCAYTSPKTTTKEVKVPRHIKKKVHVDKGYGKYGYKYVWEKVYDTKTVAQTTNGGWDKCLKPFNWWEAKEWGIDEWDCEGNCYVRKEANGDLYRGCFGGEFGVDQTWLGCNEQKGATWCFCEGDRCNNKIKIH